MVLHAAETGGGDGRGLKPRRAHVGRLQRRRFQRHDKDADRGVVGEHVKTGVGRLQTQGPVQRNGGAQRRLHVAAYELRGEAGGIAAIAGIVRAVEAFLDADRLGHRRGLAPVTPAVTLHGM